jgi:hypothetical protein
MNRYYNILITITILLSGSNFLAAQCGGACTDDALFNWNAVGPASDCSSWVSFNGGSCVDSDFFGVDVSEDCSCTCNLCPAVCGDGTQQVGETWENCSEDVPGCDLAEGTLSILPDGTVLFNTADSIGGFECRVNGGILNGAEAASGGAAGIDGAKFSLSTNPDFGGEVSPPNGPADWYLKKTSRRQYQPLHLMLLQHHLISRHLPDTQNHQ